MRKYLVILLLLASTSYSADILETFTDYRETIRRAFDVAIDDTDYASDSTLNQFVRISVATLVKPIRSNKKIFIDTTLFLTESYSLDSSITNIYGVYWKSEDSVVALDHVPVGQWSKNLGDLKKFLAESDLPLSARPYYYDFTDDELLLYPVPVKIGDTLKIMALRKVPSLAAVDSLATIPQDYRAPVFHYACYMLARAKQHPLTNNYKADFAESMALVREERVEAP